MAKLYFLPRSALKARAFALRFAWALEGAVVSVTFWLLRRMPLPKAQRFGARFFRWLGPRTPVAGKLLRNLAIIHPDADLPALRKEAESSFAALGQAVAELAHSDQICADPERFCEFVIDPASAPVLSDPKAPAVLITAHVGPWTYTNLIAAWGQFPLSILYAPESNPRVRAAFLRLRSALPVTLIPRDNSMRGLLRALGKGQKVGLASDVRLDSGAALPFFGYPMLTNTVPGRLALRANCPLIPLRAERLGPGRFRITAEAPLDPGLAHQPMEDRVQHLAVQVLQTYERWIRQAPSEWMAMARRWPKALELEALARAAARDHAA
ncbi:MAG: lysophospholipid acyltransferase family protein [Pseudomonadales bacterium]|nr:lysophospholipid acyltransferase family protein [Pseudomonadales bacterium]MBL6808162.1 lysophospholipid acyltransferase family protein [Pseudomonadales bacterium]